MSRLLRFRRPDSWQSSVICDNSSTVRSLFVCNGFLQISLKLLNILSWKFAFWVYSAENPMWLWHLFSNIYCDVPDSPCLSKTGPVVGPCISLPGAKVVCLTPHLAGTWQYAKNHCISIESFHVKRSWSRVGTVSNLLHGLIFYNFNRNYQTGQIWGRSAHGLAPNWNAWHGMTQ